MDKDLISFENKLIESKIHDEIIECNEKTREYGLQLTEKDVKELINTSYYKARGEVIKVGTKPRLD